LKKPIPHFRPKLAWSNTSAAALPEANSAPTQDDQAEDRRHGERRQLTTHPIAAHREEALAPVGVPAVHRERSRFKVQIRTWDGELQTIMVSSSRQFSHPDRLRAAFKAAFDILEPGFTLVTLEMFASQTIEVDVA
jgi:hypothetical protein